MNFSNRRRPKASKRETLIQQTSPQERLSTAIDSLEQRVLFTVLAAPTGFAAVAPSTGEIDLSWNDSNGETGYIVQSGSGTTWTNLGSTLPADTTSTVVTGLTSTTTLSPGTSYSFRLLAVNADGNSLPSTAATVSTLPSAPTLTASAASNVAVTLTWPAITGATGYTLDRSTDLNTWTNIATPTASTLTYSDTGRTSNTVYYYQLRAIDGSGDSDYSQTASVTTLMAAPTGMTATALSQTQIALSWPKLTGAFGYTVQKLTGTTWSNLAANLSSATNTYVASGLTANTPYSFRLIASNASGPSAPGATVTTTTQTAAPVLASSSTSTTGTSLTWTAVTGATGYKLERSTDDANWTQIAAPTAAAVSYADTGLTADTEYFYRLRVTNAGGDSAYSNIADQRTLLAAPTTVAAVSTSSASITVSWDAQATASGFKLQQQSGTTWVQVGDIIPAGSTSFLVSGLTANTAYTYRLIASNDAGDSAASATTTATTRLPRTKIKGSATSDTALLVSWTAVTGATGYLVQTSTDGTTYTTAVTAAANATSSPITGLTANTMYYVKVLVTSAAGNSSASNILHRTTLLPAPSNIAAATVSTSEIDLAWDQDTGDTGYIVQKQVHSTWVTLATLATDTNSYNVVGLHAGNTYNFQILALNTAGTSAGGAVTAASRVASTVATAVAASPTSITVGWVAIPGATAYEIDQSADGSTNWASVATPAAGATNAVISSLTADTPYFFRIRGSSAGGNGAWSSNATTSTLLAAPTTFAATSVSDTEIDLSWDAQATAIGFRLEKQVGTAWVQVGNLIPAGATSTAVTGLTANTAYVFRLHAVNAGGDSAASATATATTKVVAPVLTGGVFTDTTEKLTWAAVTNATGYKLERSTNPNSGWAQINAPTAATLTYTDTGLTQNTTYYYRLKATNAGGDSVPSNIVTQQTLMTAPTGLTATAQETTSVTVAWNVVAGATGYKLQQQNGTAWTQVGATLGGDVDTTDVTSLASGTAYTFRLIASDAAGDSLPSTTVTTSTLLAAPVVTAAAASSSAVTLTWPAVTGATGYKIERSLDGSSWTQIAAPVAGTLTYSDTGRNADTEYFYRMRASDAGGDSAYSAISSDTTFLAAPTMVTATTASSSSVTLAWAAQPTATGFIVEEQTGTTWTQLGDPVTAGATGETVTGLTPNTAYTFRVKAVNDGGISLPSSTVSATTTTGVSKIKGSAQSDTVVSLSWTAVTGATGYKVMKSLDGTTWTTAASVGPTVSAYSDTGLTADTSYYYAIKVTNAGGDSAMSNVLRRHTLLPAPTTFTATVGASTASVSEIDLAWDQSTGNTGYTVEKLVGTSWVLVDTLATDTNSDAITGLLAGTTYTFRVHALNTGGVSLPSAVASATTTLT